MHNQSFEEYQQLVMPVPQGGKYILKQLGRKILPKEIVDRPKGYFPVSALKYIEDPHKSKNLRDNSLQLEV